MKKKALSVVLAVMLLLQSVGSVFGTELEAENVEFIPEIMAEEVDSIEESQTEEMADLEETPFDDELLTEDISTPDFLEEDFNDDLIQPEEAPNQIESDTAREAEEESEEETVVSEEAQEEEAAQVGASVVKAKLSAPVITGVYNSVKGGDIYWEAVDGATGYIVYRFRAAEKTRKIAEIKDGSVTHCYDTTIQNNCWGRVYRYYVAAVKDGVSGNWSKPAILQRVAAMKISSVSNTGTSGVLKASWSVTSGAANKAHGYQVQYAESTSDLYGRKGSYKFKTVTGRNNTSTTISGLTTAKTYYFRVRCYVDYTSSGNGVRTRTWSQYSGTKSIKVSSDNSMIAAYKKAIIDLSWESAVFAVVDINGDGLYEVIVEAVVDPNLSYHAYRKGQILYFYNGALKRYSYGPDIMTFESVNSSHQLVFGRTRGKAIFTIRSFSLAEGVKNVTAFFLPYLSESEAEATRTQYLSGPKYPLFKAVSTSNLDTYLSGNGKTTGSSASYAGNGLSNI